MPSLVLAGFTFLSLSTERMADVAIRLPVKFWHELIFQLNLDFQVETEKIQELDDLLMWEVRIGRFLAADPTMTVQSILQNLSAEDTSFANNVIKKIREKNEFLGKQLQDKWVTLFDLDRLGDLELRELYAEFSAEKWMAALRLDDPELLDRIQTLLPESQRQELDQFLLNDYIPEKNKTQQARREILQKVLKKGEGNSKFNLSTLRQNR